MELQKRLKKIKHLGEKVDGILLLNTNKNANFFYFTNSDVQGFFFHDFSRPRLMTNIMELGRARKSWVKPKEAKLKDFLKQMKGKTIGIDKKGVDAYLYEKIKKKIKCVDISEQLEKTRAVKTQYEIKCIKKACSLSKRVFSSVIIKGTEKNIRANVDYEINKCADVAFPTIVASGNNIAFPHHIPGDKKATKPVLIDFGVRYNGYVSDVTRTIGSRYEQILKKVIKSLEQNIVPGIRSERLDAMARQKLGKHKKHFITSLGHGIGLDVHERPYISKNSIDTLAPGMVFTLEPGIYVKSGIRIENDYLMTKKGVMKLTPF